ncbi:MerR family transcriptional regulator [Neoroseomonas lacus]|uniref:Helix-turn-helix domain-containing protein n=1 Tax=Neoroseomonas lacus TaxID=287609 RepID=A0A917L3B4_9PROT|nr:hypothetical protein [Neoroseomonas lacus]GGJ40872.1 hypothetical protein GCM10011320_55650 [Neoroseomonas lacus]
MSRAAQFEDRILDIGELARIEGKCRRTIRRMLKDGRLKNVGEGRARGTWLSDYLRSHGRHKEADALLRPVELSADVDEFGDDAG